MFFDFNYRVHIQWCKGHIWRGNIIADELADQSIKDTKDRYQQLTQIKSTTPFSIRSVKHIFKSQIYTYFKQTQLNNSHLISNRLVLWNVFKEYNMKYVIADMEILTKFQCKIITQLRTEQSNLNYCNHVLQTK